ncbi:MAG: DUF2059 domain-containing protein, partial [Candidatus Omnitrophota bacterium]
MRYFAKMVVMVMVLAVAGIVPAQAQEAQAQDSHRKAAEEFFIAMGTPEQLEEAVTDVVGMQLEANPMMKQYREDLLSFYNKYLNWQNLKEGYIDIAIDVFTEKELRGATDFFQTEVGKSFAQKQPEVFQRTAQLGMRTIQQHQDELMQVFEEEAAQGEETEAEEATEAPAGE